MMSVISMNSIAKTRSQSGVPANSCIAKDTSPVGFTLIAGLLVTILFTPPALAAPDEEALGKAEGYPVCAREVRPQTHCLVGMVSHFDEIFPARKVSMGTQTHPLKRAATEPAIRYRFQSQVNALDDYLSRNRTTGLLILKDNTILAERYQYERTPEQRMTSFSMAKTVVAMLVGIAVAEGKIKSIGDRAEKYVPELRGTHYGETAIRHLLTMSSGVKFSEVYSGSDDVATLVRLSLLGESEGGAATLKPFNTRERAPGKELHYASADTQVLGLILRAATGRPLTEYLSEKIWQPMGAEADASWNIDKGGFEVAYIGVNATLRDYARFGLLLANGGSVDGKQIIPAAWVRSATTPSARQFEPGHTRIGFGYGYQIWLLGGKGRQFMLRGVRGQAMLVDPKRKLVMVHTMAGNIGDPSFGELLALWSGVIESVGK